MGSRCQESFAKIHTTSFRACRPAADENLKESRFDLNSSCSSGLRRRTCTLHLAAWLSGEDEEKFLAALGMTDTREQHSQHYRVDSHVPASSSEAVESRSGPVHRRTKRA